MILLACGLNHKTCDLALREQAAIGNEQLPSFLAKLLVNSDVFEVVVLSTCNRTEIYANGKDANVLLKMLARYCNIDYQLLQDVSYHYYKQDMVRHVMRVACGLDSMIVGEPQILGQLKQAVAIAKHQATLGVKLSLLFQYVFRVAKKIRAHTMVGACPVSVASTAVRLAQDIFSSLDKLKVLLIGAGDTVALAAKHLSKRGVRHFIIASRHIEKAQYLAQQFNAKAIGLHQLSAYLAKIDVVFSATASQLPILTKADVTIAQEQRQYRPLVIIDIALPRDVDSQVSELEGVALYDIDDLKKIVDANLENRQHSAQKAEAMIIDETQAYMNQQRLLKSAGTIRAFRERISTLQQQELVKSLEMLKRGVAPEKVVCRMASALSNKLMHLPTVKMRQAAKQGHAQFIAYVQELFDLDNG